MQIIKNFPWKLEPPPKYRASYGAACLADNADRLRAVGLIILIVITCLLVQHIASPGVPRTSATFIPYMVIYLALIAGLVAYLTYDRLASSGAGSAPAQWALVLMMLAGSAGLAVLDNAVNGDLTVLLLGLIGTSVIFRCRLIWFASLAAASIAVFMGGSYLFSGKLIIPGMWVPLALYAVTTMVISVAVGYYDIRSFIMQQDLKAALSEKELILKEVHHRIKNNMISISGLLNLHAGSVKDAAAIDALNDARNRVQSMMILYDKLYQSAEFRTLSIREYLVALVDHVVGNFSGTAAVKIEKRIDDFNLDVKKLQPIGIIINELLTNIMKYAFTGRNEGLITVEAALIEKDLKPGSIRISIQDNGNGMPASVDFENSNGFGLMLVGMITKQLHGTIRIERDNGTKVVLELNI